MRARASGSASAPGTTARLFMSLLAARVAFGLAYLIGSARRSPIPLYYPIERRWTFFDRLPEGLAMEWYGRTAVALLVAIVVLAAFWIASARGPIARAMARPENVIAAARGGALILLVDFAYFGWVLMHQTPAPLPLPDPARMMR